LVLPFWYRLTGVVPDKGPLNVCVCVCVDAMQDVRRRSHTIYPASTTTAVCTATCTRRRSSRVPRRRSRARRRLRRGASSRPTCPADRRRLITQPCSRLASTTPSSPTSTTSPPRPPATVCPAHTLYIHRRITAVIQLGVVRGSILCDPTQPNPWVNPTHGQLWYS